MGKICRYWWRVLKRAFANTWEFCGHSKKRIITGIGLFTITLAILWFLGESTKIPEKMTLAAIGIGAVVLFFIVCFAWFVFAAPAELEEESAGKAEQALNGLRGDVQCLTIKIEELKRQVAVQEQKHKDELAARDRTKAVDPHHAAIHRKIQDYLARFEALGNGIANGDRNAGAEVYTLEYRTLKYLEEHLRSYRDFDTCTDCHVGTDAPRAHQVKMEDARKRCLYRIDRLKEVLRLFE
jgi:hypothetical protein